MRETGSPKVDNLQESKTEDAHEECFLFPWQAEMPENGQRQRKDGNVGDDVSSCVDVPLRLVGDAVRHYGFVPEPFDWEALERGDEDLRG